MLGASLYGHTLYWPQSVNRLHDLVHHSPNAQHYYSSVRFAQPDYLLLHTGVIAILPRFLAIGDLLPLDSAAVRHLASNSYFFQARPTFGHC